jgi:hypothetical protein
MAIEAPAFSPRIVSPRVFQWTTTMAGAIVRRLLLELRTVLWFQSFWEYR